MRVTKETRGRIAKNNATKPVARGHPVPVMRVYPEEMDRMLGELGIGMGLDFPEFLSTNHDPLGEGSRMGLVPWLPRVEIVGRAGDLVIRVDLPGVTKDEINIEASDDLLTIHGERMTKKKGHNEGYLYSELSYGTFSRAIPLPAGADAAKITAEFHNGELAIIVPMHQHKRERPHRVGIRKGK